MSDLKKFRESAWARQNGLCCYCDLPMAPSGVDVSTLAKRLFLSPERVSEIVATAEHLQARCDGGRDCSANIAAAHWVCNQIRHRMRPAPPPERFKVIARTCLNNGTWFKANVRQRLQAVSEGISPW